MDIDDVIVAADVYRTIAPKNTIERWEKAGRFPRRMYLDADCPTPRRPFWSRKAINAWLYERECMAAEARAKVVQKAARLRESRRHPNEG